MRSSLRLSRCRRQPGGAKSQKGPAEFLKFTISKDFRKMWGLSVLRDTENLSTHFLIQVETLTWPIK